MRGDNRARFDHVETAADAIVLAHQVLTPVPCQCNLRVVLVADTKHHRRAVRLSMDVDVDTLTIYRYDKARCHIELLFRDAQQFIGVTDGQGRSQAQRTVHFNASLSAVTLAKLAARQHNGDTASGFSMASLKRRAFNHHLIERIAQH